MKRGALSLTSVSVISIAVSPLFRCAKTGAESCAKTIILDTGFVSKSNLVFTETAPDDLLTAKLRVEECNSLRILLFKNKQKKLVDTV